MVDRPEKPTWKIARTFQRRVVLNFKLDFTRRTLSLPRRHVSDTPSRFLFPGPTRSHLLNHFYKQSRQPCIASPRLHSRLSPLLIARGFTVDKWNNDNSNDNNDLCFDQISREPVNGNEYNMLRHCETNEVQNQFLRFWSKRVLFSSLPILFARIKLKLLLYKIC